MSSRYRDQEASASCSDDEVAERQSSRRMRERSRRDDQSSSDEELPNGVSDSDSDAQSDEEREEELKASLKSIPFGERLSATSDGTTRVQRTRVQQAIEEARASARRRRHQKKRENIAKDGPAEMTSKVPTSRFRQVLPTQRRVSRDPRFDDLSGTLIEDHFDSSYKFLDELQQTELQQMKDQLKKTRDPEQQKVLHKAISIMQQRSKAKQEQRQFRQFRSEVRQQEAAKVAEGKPAFYRNDVQLRREFREKQLEERKKQGGLKKYMAKREMRKGQREKRMAPTTRRNPDAPVYTEKRERKRHRE